jgi:hypothetical protein
MRISFRALAAVVAISATMTGASIVPSFAQTTTVPNPAPPKAAPHKRHILHPGIGSAASRNVGPSSTVGGASAPVGTSGSPGIVPGAPAAGAVNGGGSH